MTLVPNARARFEETGLRQQWTLFRTLWIRDFSAQYRRAKFGIGWAVIQPLFYMTVFIGLRLFLDIPSEGLPYPVFVFSALMPWLYISNALNRSGASVVSNADIIKKISVNRFIFPLVSASLPLVDLTVMALGMFGLMIAFGVPLGPHLLWLAPLLLLLTGFAVGLGLLICAIGTFVRDILVALPVVLQAFLFVSPIVYPIDIVPEALRGIYILNPLVGLLESFRSVLGRGTAPDMEMLISPVAVTIIMWIIAVPLYQKLSRYFSDVL
ncbi:ABC transporter permease [Rhodospira trueperi]|uniref:Transport permease protein n=1 Tax=Rhodospira trueperi TaxID=69960 RepID=A0A1G7GPX5_9PROT|nr:ABC transporter permease [Rhodospira trueperi]SDE90039.1 lipopolysaccharide transport system permease protein [Rhodospira trueperi]